MNVYYWTDRLVMQKAVNDVKPGDFCDQGEPITVGQYAGCLDTLAMCSEWHSGRDFARNCGLGTCTTCP